MIRSTPSWSGSGNMTPASITMVVSATTPPSCSCRTRRDLPEDDLERGRRHDRHSGLIHRSPASHTADRPRHATIVRARLPRGSRRAGTWRGGWKRFNLRLTGAVERCRRENRAGSTTSGENYSTASKASAYVGDGQGPGPLPGSRPARAMASSAERPSDPPRLERIQQGLAAMDEHAADDSSNAGSTIATSAAAGIAADQAEVTFGAGRNAPGGSVRRRSTSATRPVQRQGAVARRSRAGHEPVGDLLLKHQVASRTAAPLSASAEKAKRIGDETL